MNMKQRSYDKHYGKIHLKVEYIYGDRYTTYKGEIHRDDGRPAVVRCDGTNQWLRNGKFHREDGPAVVLADGTENYYLHDTLISTKKEYEELLGLRPSPCIPIK